MQGILIILVNPNFSHFSQFRNLYPCRNYCFEKNIWTFM